MKSISMDDFVALHNDGLTLVDVREPAEYVEAHVPGALLIPLGELAGRCAEVPGTAPVYVICRSGNRSKVGVSLLEAGGIEAINVENGTQGWLDRGLSVVTGRQPR